MFWVCTKNGNKICYKYKPYQFTVAKRRKSFKTKHWPTRRRFVIFLVNKRVYKIVLQFGLMSIRDFTIEKLENEQTLAMSVSKKSCEKIWIVNHSSGILRMFIQMSWSPTSWKIRQPQESQNQNAAETIKIFWKF